MDYKAQYNQQNHSFGFYAYNNTHMDLQEVGQQIATIRKDKRLTQVQLAALAGLSRATVDAFENGRASDIGTSRLIRILGVLGLELVVRPATQERPTLEELLEEARHN